MIPKIPSSWALNSQPIVSAKSGAGNYSGSRNPQNQKKRAHLRAVPSPEEPEENVAEILSGKTTPEESPLPAPPLKNNFFTQAWVSLLELLQSKAGGSWTMRGPRTYLTMLLRGKTAGKFKKGSIIDHRAE